MINSFENPGFSEEDQKKEEPSPEGESSYPGFDDNFDQTPRSLEELNRQNEECAEAVSEEIVKSEPNPEKKKEGKSKIKQLFLSLGLSAAVITTSFSLLRDGGNDTSLEKEQETEAVESQADKEAPKKILLEKLGVDFAEMAERHGFDLSLKVDNSDGDYLLHIGQAHKMGELVIEDTRKSQGAVYNLLSEYHKKTGTRLTLFSEGFTEESMGGLEYLRENYQQTGLMPDVSKIYKETGRTAGNEETLASRGADFDLYIKDLADIVPTEDKKLQEKIIEYENDLLDISKGLGKERHELLTEKSKIEFQFEFGEISEEEFSVRNGEVDRKLDEIRNKLREMVYERRENLALEKILNYQNRNEGEGHEDNRITEKGIFPVIYGSEHNFSETVLRHNAENPDNRLGLIKIELSSNNP